MVMESIDVNCGPDGTPIIGEGPALVGFTLGLLFQGSADPRWLTVEAGDVVLRGVDADGAPVELRYRATDFDPGGSPEANEGGILICRRVT